MLRNLYRVNYYVGDSAVALNVAAYTDFEAIAHVGGLVITATALATDVEADTGYSKLGVLGFPRNLYRVVCRAGDSQVATNVVAYSDGEAVAYAGGAGTVITVPALANNVEIAGIDKSHAPVRGKGPVVVAR